MGKIEKNQSGETEKEAGIRRIEMKIKTKMMIRIRKGDGLVHRHLSRIENGKNMKLKALKECLA